MTPGSTLRALFALLLLPALTPLEAAPPEVGFTPAWGGRFLPGRPTELGVHLVSDTGGEFEISTSGPAGSSHYRGLLDAGLPLQVWLPVRPAPDRPLRVTIELGGKEGERLQRELHFTPVRRALAVRLAAEPPRADAIPPLPRTAEGYAPVGELTLSPALLPKLQADQILALDRYLARCGQLHLPDADPRLLERIRAAAGCGGRYVGRLDGAPGHPPPPLPGTGALETLLPVQTSGPLQGLLLFFLVYIGLLLTASLLPRYRKPLLLALPALSATALLLLWPLQPSPPGAAGWAEMQSGETSARFALLLALGEQKDPGQRLSLSRVLGTPAGDPAALFLDARHRALEAVPFPARPFEQARYRFQGAIRHDPGVTLEGQAADAPPRVVNRGAHPSRPGLLSWHGILYRLPTLPPGTRWSPDDKRLLEAGAAPARLLRRATAGGPGALLLPLDLHETGLIPKPVKAQGWLLIRAQEPRT